ncbi:MAG: CPBP family intramembrane metalloprotease [Candidatus Omnitrophica bacterium]|nr:CPBP family intramembrane metalloprotease [Candidatus Omnitrophota bacterium]
MLKPLLDLIRREKFYSILFVLVLGIYSYVAWMSHNQKDDREDKASLKRFEQAEDSFEQKVKDPKSLQKFLRENPKMAFSLQAGSSFIFAGLVLGVWIQYRYLFKPELREKIKVEPQADSMRWIPGILFKAILLFLLTSFVLTIILGAAKRFLFPGLSDHFLILTHTILSNLFCVYFMMHFIRKQGGSFQSLGFRLPSKSFFSEVLIGWMGYLAIIPLFAVVLTLVSLVSKSFGSEPDPHPLVYMFLDETGSRQFLIYTLLIAVVLAPMLEEIFFRGFCYPVFKHCFGKSIGMVVTASIFAAIHGSLFAFWPIFVLGLVLTYLYELRQSLVAPMVLHITHNAIFISYFFLLKQVILAPHGGS